MPRAGDQVRADPDRRGEQWRHHHGGARPEAIGRRPGCTPASHGGLFGAGDAAQGLGPGVAGRRPGGRHGRVVVRPSGRGEGRQRHRAPSQWARPTSGAVRGRHRQEAEHTLMSPRWVPRDEHVHLL